VLSPATTTGLFPLIFLNHTGKTEISSEERERRIEQGPNRRNRMTEKQNYMATQGQESGRKARKRAEGLWWAGALIWAGVVFGAESGSAIWLSRSRKRR